MSLNIEERDLKSGLLSLVVAVAEIIVEALRLEAVRRVEGGSLSDGEAARLGEALLDLDASLERLKTELGISRAVRALRDDIDRSVDAAVDALLNEEGRREDVSPSGRVSRSPALPDEVRAPASQGEGGRG